MSANKCCVGYLFLSFCLSLISCQTTTNSYHRNKQKQLIVYASPDTQTALREANRYGSVAKAIEAHQKKVIKNRRDVKTLIKISRLYLVLGKTKKAKKYADLVKKIDYRNRDAKIILANIAFIKGFYQSAKLMLTQLGGARAPEHDILNLLAGVHLKQNEDNQSIKYLKLAIKRSPTYVAAHMNIGLIYLKHQEYQLAKRHFQRILMVLPENQDALLHNAICLAALKDYGEAMRVYKKILRSSPNHPLVLFNIAVLQFRQKKYQATIDSLQTYVDNAPSRYVARRAAMEIIDEIQLENVRRGGISKEDIETLSERLQKNGNDSDHGSLSFDKGNEITSKFVFTSVGYIPE